MKLTRRSDLKKEVSRLWDRGLILSSCHSDEPIFPFRLKFRGPTSAGLLENFESVRSWISEILSTPHVRVESREFNHRVLGRNDMPSEVWLDTFEEAVAFLGKKKEARMYQELVEYTRENEPSLVLWLKKRPLKSLELFDAWQDLLRVVRWLRDNPRPEVFVRQVDIPGIDSKFIESNRATLSELFDETLPASQIDHYCKGVGNFSPRYGFRQKPVRVRFRILDERQALVSGVKFPDITLDGESFSALDLACENVFITENETNFLCFEELESSIVVFGSGYGFDVLGNAHWLKERRVFYWGDIDTHGFAILSSLREKLPRLESILMDRETLQRHQHLIGREESPSAVTLPSHLTPEETKLYLDLKANKFGDSVRLEQERIGWRYAWEKLSAVVMNEHVTRTS